MKYSQLFQIVRDVRLDDETSQISGASDSLAEPETTFLLFTEALNRYCAYTGALIDTATVAEVEIALSATKTYQHAANILNVLSVRLSDSLQALTKVPQDWLENVNASSLDPFPWAASVLLSPGRPAAYALNAGARAITLDREPAADLITAALKLVLRVEKTPSAEVTVNDLESEPPIHPAHHFGLTYFVAAELLDTPSADKERRAAGRVFRTQWESYLVSARADVQRRSRGPMFFSSGGRFGVS